MGGPVGLTPDQRFEHHKAKWSAKWGVKVEELELLWSDHEARRSSRAISEFLKIPMDQAMTIQVAFKNAGASNDNGTPEVTVPGHFTEALRLAAHLSKLNEEEHKLETRLAEIKAEKAKYAGVVNAMNALQQQVQRVKQGT